MNQFQAAPEDSECTQGSKDGTQVKNGIISTQDKMKR